MRCTTRPDCHCATCAAEAAAPRPDEIARRAAAIRRTWSRAERLRRIADDATRDAMAGGMLPQVLPVPDGVEIGR